MSDEQREQRERAEDQAPEEDVEAHGFSAPHDPDAPIGATEEPPDVEGHNMGAPNTAPNTRPIQ